MDILSISILKVDNKEKLHDGRDISDDADAEDDDLELLNGDEHRPKGKGTPNLFQECWKRNGEAESLSEIFLVMGKLENRYVHDL